MADNVHHPKNNPNYIGGLILIGLGSIFLLQQWFSWARWDRLWPLIIIAIGVALVIKNATAPTAETKNNDKPGVPEEPVEASEVEVVDVEPTKKKGSRRHE